VGADPVLGALAAACPAARPAGPGDAVAGVMPRFAASPATVAEAGALLAAAAAADLAVVPRGGGSKLGWGAPPRRCDLVVDTTALDQVVEHAAGGWARPSAARSRPGRRARAACATGRRAT